MIAGTCPHCAGETKYCHDENGSSYLYCRNCTWAGGAPAKSSESFAFRVVIFCVCGVLLLMAASIFFNALFPRP